MYLSEIALHFRKHVFANSPDWKYFVNAVGFLASKYLSESKIETNGPRKVVVYLGEQEDSIPFEEPIDRVFEIYKRFDITPDQFGEAHFIQLKALDIVCEALAQLKMPNKIPEDAIQHMRESLIRDGFEQYVPLTAECDRKWLKCGQLKHLRLRMKTGAQSFGVVVELKSADGTTCYYHLLHLRPSWLLARTNFVSCVLEKKVHTLTLTMRHPGVSLEGSRPYIEETLFGRTYYDISNSAFPNKTVIDKRNVVFSFDISELTTSASNQI